MVTVGGAILTSTPSTDKMKCMLISEVDACTIPLAVCKAQHFAYGRPGHNDMLDKCWTLSVQLLKPRCIW